MMPKFWPFGRKGKPQSIQVRLKSTYELPEHLQGANGTSPSSNALRKHFDLLQTLADVPASKRHGIAKTSAAFAPTAAKAFRKQRWDKLPRHPGFQRLAIDAERENDYSAAIAVCREALSQGWNGDWEKRIERCEGKISKQQRRQLEK